MNLKDGAVVAALVAFLAALSGIHDLDVWFHLRTGQLIAATGAIPRVDTLSHTRVGAAWVTHEWAYELPLYALWLVGGLEALIVLSAALAAAAAAVLVKACRVAGASTSAALLTVLAGVVVATPRFTVRPHMVSAVLTAVTLYLCLRHPRRADRAVWLLVPTFAAWANLHAGVVVGVIVVGVYAVEEALRNRRPGVLAAVGAACAVAVLVNPHGWGVYWYPWFLLDAHRSELLQLVEMLPPEVPDPVHALAGLTALAGLALVVAGRHSEVGVGSWALAALGLALGLTRRRASLDMALHVAPLLSAGLTVAGGVLRERVRSAAASVSGQAVTGAAAVALLVAMGWRPTLAVDGWAIPADAMRFVESARLSGNLYNSHAFGAWLLWAHPDRPVYFDGRNEIFIDLFNETRDTPLPALTERYGLGVAVVEYLREQDQREIRFALDNGDVFVADAAWALVYFDDVARVYARRTPEHADVIARFGYEALRPGWTDLAYLSRAVAAPGGRDRVDLETRRALEAAPASRVARMHRAEFLRLVGRDEEALAEFRAVPGDAFALGREGAIHLVRGDAAAAATSFDAALAVDQRNANLWSNLGLARLRSGDVEGARSAVERALALDPDLLAAHRNLVLVREVAGDVAGAERARASVAEREDALAREAFTRGQSLLEQGFAGRAATELEAASELRPDNANVAYLLGVARHLAGDDPGAETALRRALALSPGHAYAKLELAGVLGASGRREEAQALLRVFLAQNAEPRWDAVAEQRLAALAQDPGR